MNLESSQLYVLKELGIPVWQMRTADETVNDSPIEAIDLTAYSCILITDLIEQGSAEQRLLTAILHAGNIDAEKTVILSATQAEHQVRDLEIKTVICFGQSSKLEPTLPNLINIPALSELLAKPSLKAIAWVNLTKGIGQSAAA